MKVNVIVCIGDWKRVGEMEKCDKHPNNRLLRHGKKRPRQADDILFRYTEVESAKIHGTTHGMCTHVVVAG